MKYKDDLCFLRLSLDLLIRWNRLASPVSWEIRPMGSLKKSGTAFRPVLVPREKIKVKSKLYVRKKKKKKKIPPKNIKTKKVNYMYVLA
jgi:hypothetical protein